MGIVEISDFNDLINLGRITKAVEVNSHKIVLGTLNAEEYSAAMARIPEELQGAARMERIQREVIATAIQSIDSRVLDVDTRVKILSMGQLALSNLLYTEYVEMIGDQDKILEEAKKNSSQAQKVSPSSPKVPASR